MWLAGLPLRDPQEATAGSGFWKLRGAGGARFQVGRLGHSEVKWLAHSHTVRPGHPSCVLPLLMAPVAVGQVDRAEVWDAGRYTCEALNQAGRSEKHYNLNVWGEGLLGWAVVPPALPLRGQLACPGGLLP